MNLHELTIGTGFRKSPERFSLNSIFIGRGRISFTIATME